MKEIIELNIYNIFFSTSLYAFLLNKLPFKTFSFVIIIKQIDYAVFDF